MKKTLRTLVLALLLVSMLMPAMSLAETTDEIVELDVFIDHTWYWTDQFEGIIPEAITAATGVKLNVTRAVDDMQLGVMIASGDLPDLVYTSQLFDRLSDENVSYDWDTLIAEYAPDFTLSDTQKMIGRSYSTDGKFYTILNAFSPEEEWRAAKAGCPTLGTLMYRQDIVDELGLGPIETLDDFVAALAAVKEAYPDMTPIVLEPSFRLDVFKAWLVPGSLPITSNLMETDDGEIIHITSAPEYEEFLTFVNMLYREGYISADNFAFTDGSQAEELAQNNLCFAYTFCTGDSNSVFTTQTQANGYPDALWVQSLPLVDVPYYTVGTGWSGTFITKNNKNPEKSIQFLEYLFSEEGQRLSQWGREGIEYELDEDGIPQFSEEWIATRDDEQAFYKIYNPAFYFGISQVTEAVGRASGTSENASQLMDAIRENLRLVTLPALVEPKGDTDERMMLDQIIEFMKNQEIKIVLSNSDDEFAKNIEEMRTTLDRIGVHELEASLTAATEAYK